MNKKVLVTGGGRGIGAATALLLGTRGFDVCINYRSDEKSAQSVVSALAKLDKKAFAIQADIACEKDVMRLFETLDQSFGQLDCLVNNAGIIAPQMRLELMSESRINQLLRTNVTGAFLCCREAVRRMSISHGGTGGAIVNVSSLASRTGSPEEYIDYAATKGALDTLTIGLSKEVAKEGIRVNGVRPGFIDTQMHADGGEPDRINRLTPSIPLGRGGEPEEVAHAIVWLLSDEASYTTGTFIDVAGGR